MKERGIALLRRVREDRKLQLIIIGLIAVMITLGVVVKIMTQGTPVKDNKTTKVYTEKLPGLKAKAEADPKNAALQVEYGQALYVAGNKKEAEKAFTTASQNDPKNALALTMLGNVKRDNQEYGAAEVSYKKAIEVEPTAQTAYMNLGNLQLYSLQKPVDAIATYKKAISVFGQTPQLLFALGQAYELNNQKDFAKQTYQDILTIDKNFAPAREAIARLK